MFNLNTESKANLEKLVTQNLEVGSRFQMDCVQSFGKTPEWTYFDATYEGTADDAEVEDLSTNGHLTILAMDINRSEHHLVWIKDENNKPHLYLYDFLYFSFLEELPEIISNKILEA